MKQSGLLSLAPYNLTMFADSSTQMGELKRWGRVWALGLSEVFIPKMDSVEGFMIQMDPLECVPLCV